MNKIRVAFVNPSLTREEKTRCILPDAIPGSDISVAVKGNFHESGRSNIPQEIRENSAPGFELGYAISRYYGKSEEEIAFRIKTANIEENEAAEGQNFESLFPWLGTDCAVTIIGRKFLVIYTSSPYIPLFYADSDCYVIVSSQYESAFKMWANIEVKLGNRIFPEIKVLNPHEAKVFGVLY